MKQEPLEVFFSKISDEHLRSFYGSPPEIKKKSPQITCMQSNAVTCGGNKKIYYRSHCTLKTSLKIKGAMVI